MQSVRERRFEPSVDLIALRENILPDGGLALLRATEVLKRVRTSNEDQKHGWTLYAKRSLGRRAKLPSMQARMARSRSARSLRRILMALVSTRSRASTST